MIESKLAKIILLDGSQLDFHITPDILTSDLLDMVASYLTLKEKDYFGLCYVDTTGHRNWLQPDKKVLDYEFPKKPNALLILFFRVKFYIENISLTKDKIGVELFYQQAKLSVAQGEIDVNNELLFELTALVLQATFGDYKNDSDTIKHLRTQPILPKTFFNTPNLAFKEQKIITHYKKCTNMNSGQCIVNYLTIITEKQCNYGVHFYEVKDKSNLKWFLGISFRGIGLYECNNKMSAKKMFSWSNLENLYYRDRKFSIEVHENCNEIRTQQFQQPQQNNNDLNEDTFNPVKVYAWFAPIPTLCKSIWLMAVSQHQFFLDKRQSKDVLLQYKSLTDLAYEITNGNSNTLNNVNNATTTNTTNTTTTNKNETESNELVITDESTEKTQLLHLLKRKQEILKLRLEMKRGFFNKVKTREENLIECSKQLNNNDNNNNGKASSMLSIVTILRELKEVLSEYQQNKGKLRSFLDDEYEVQKKLIFVALNLASDPSAPQIIQKARREFYQRAKSRFTNLEEKRENMIEKCPQNSFLPSEQKPTIVNRNFTDMLLKIPSLNYGNNTKMSPHFMIEDFPAFFESSPPSIHRKDSYRLAQEHKLFLENNSGLLHKPNRAVNGRRIKNILSDRQFNCSVNTNHLNGKEINILDNTFFKVNNSLNNFEKVYENNLYDVKSYKDESNNGNNSNSSNITEQQTLHRQQFSTTSSDCADLNSVNSDKVLFEINAPHLYQNDLDAINNQIKNNNCNEIPLKFDHLSNPSFITKRPTQRKNTSDSNVKLLADHNFYHISNNINSTNTNNNNNNHNNNNSSSNSSINNINHTKSNDFFNPKSSNFSYKEAYDSLCNNSNGTNVNKINFKVNARPYELAEYLELKTNYRRGLNSSSNSLISLNENSASPKEEANFVSQEKEMIRSNPDLNNELTSKKSFLFSNSNSPKNLPISPSNNLTASKSKQRTLDTQLSVTDINFNNSMKKEINTFSTNSNNGSLNLSIHTAEEFSIEMLSWLRNETSNNTSKNNFLNLPENSLEQIDNATLV